jgi:hypothetical protein
LSQEDAIIIAKSENACADYMLLEDDIPEDFSIKMHTIKDSSAYWELSSAIKFRQILNGILLGANATRPSIRANISSF